MVAYRVWVTDQAGDLVAGSGPDGQIADVEVVSITWELDGPGACTVRIPTTHPDSVLFQFGREVEVDDGSTVLFVGPIVRPRVELDTVTIQCAGPLWYFTRRYFGRADRVNLLTNGDFEDGETGWTFEGGVTHSVETSEVLEGTKALRLTGGGGDEYATKTYTHVTQYHPDGDLVTIAGWLYIPSADYVAPNIDSFGLYAERRSSDGTLIADAIPNSPIDDDTLKDEWLPFELSFASVVEDDQVIVRLYAPEGVAIWDLVTVTLMESLAFGANTDLADAAGGIVLYAQDRFPGFTHGKSDLRIDPDPTATGVPVERVYLFSEHRNIADALQEFTRDGLAEFSIDTDRTFHIHVPRKGSDIEIGLEGPLKLDVDIQAFTWSFDGAQAASSDIELGPGDGPDRPEGGASDPGAFGGLTAEAIGTAPEATLIRDLDRRAETRLALLKRPEIVEVTGYPGNWIGVPDTGDRLEIELTRGPWEFTGSYRVAALTLDGRTDQVTLTLNPETT